MQPLTHSGRSFAGFRQNNDILFRTNIVKGDGVAVNGPYYENHVIGRADVIDLNGNYNADLNQEPSGFLRKRFMYSEPVLTESVDTLQRLAWDKHSEVLTKEDTGSAAGVKEYGVDVGQTAFQDIKEVERGYRSLDSLKDQIVGYQPEAQWAIRPETREFYIFKPKTPETPEPAAPPRPFAVDSYETDSHKVSSVNNSTDQAPMSVFMTDDESLSVQSGDGRSVKIDGAVSAAMKDGVADTIQRAMIDPDFAIQGVRTTFDKQTGERTFMLHDNSVYFEYSSQKGFQKGELGS